MFGPKYSKAGLDMIGENLCEVGKSSMQAILPLKDCGTRRNISGSYSLMQIPDIVFNLTTHLAFNGQNFFKIVVQASIHPSL